MLNHKVFSDSTRSAQQLMPSRSLEFDKRSFGVAGPYITMQKCKAEYFIVIRIWKTLPQTNEYWMAKPTFGMHFTKRANERRLVPRCSYGPANQVY